MSIENDTPDFEYVFVTPESHLSTSDGDITVYRASGNVDGERTKEMMAAAYGMDKDELAIESESRDQRSRVAVAFSKWRSSWDPHTPKGDPDLN